jgi:NADH:ubiquinone reductase (non-electrogenic)
MISSSSRVPKEFGRAISKNTVNVRALGDCSTTKFAPTAQVAAQQGSYLARLFNTMARTNALEAEIASLQAQSQAPETKELLTQKQKDLSKIKLMKPFEYSHQGFAFFNLLLSR